MEITHDWIKAVSDAESPPFCRPPSTHTRVIFFSFFPFVRVPTRKLTQWRDQIFTLVPPERPLVLPDLPLSSVNVRTCSLFPNPSNPRWGVTEMLCRTRQAIIADKTIELPVHHQRRQTIGRQRIIEYPPERERERVVVEASKSALTSWFL